jgi:hypothetical protein
VNGCGSIPAYEPFGNIRFSRSSLISNLVK